MGGGNNTSTQAADNKNGATNWIDDVNDYELNEVAINWNAPLVYALASFLAPNQAPTPTADAAPTDGKAGDAAAVAGADLAADRGPDLPAGSDAAIVGPDSKLDQPDSTNKSHQAGTSAPDAGSDTPVATVSDGGTGPRKASKGSGCSLAATTSPGSAALLAIGIALLLPAIRRRRRRR